MSDTYGLFSPSSSASADLQRSLASKLRQRFDLAGSIEYSLTWRGLTTPAQRHVCRLRASARRTSGKGCSGWQTPKASDTFPPRDPSKRLKTDRQTRTPGLPGNYKLDLADQVALSGWPTPNVPNGGRQPAEGTISSTGQSAKGKRQVDLGMAAQLAGWGTPGANDWKGASSTREKESRGQLKHQLPCGPTPDSSPAETGKPAAFLQEKMLLNPFFSLYLMGFPIQWGLVMTSALMQRKKG